MSWIITGTQKNNWTPAEITTALWLDAADASTITESGGAVSQWNDKSGNTRNASQSVLASRPVYSSTAFNGKPTLIFDGVNDFLQVSSFATGSDCTIVAVVTLLAAKNYPMIYSCNSAGGSFDFRGVDTSGKPSIVNVGNNSGAGVQSAPATAVSTTDSMLNTTNILIGKIVGNSSTLRQNGSLRDTRALIFTGVTNDRQIGARGGVFPWDGRISEIIELGNISVFDEERIEGYLAHKWGLTANLPSDHPYKTAVPVP
jgi:hypothetical protein